MKDPFVYSVRRFLEECLEPHDIILLAFSGGPDSSALLEALLESIPRFPLQIHVAHVDHGWREESREEAMLLKERVESKGVFFHHTRLELQGQTNLEDRSREARYQFFEKLYQQLGAKALLLGHHKDDLAETVLKRLFEGAHLENLGGMQKRSFLRGQCLLRPLLDWDKKKILEWLVGKNVSYLIDPTNEDPRFLRSRFRKKMIPFLEEEFGKNIKDNLILLSKRSFRLKEYLEKKHLTENEPVEIEHALLEASKEYKIGLSASECDILISGLLQKKKVQINRKEGTWVANKGEIFILLENLILPL
jgi:tRNA(Ile)-lysidine synthase